MDDIKKIEDLINDYATFADTRQADAQLGLFTKNARSVVYFPAKPNEAQIIEGSDALLNGFSALKQYERTFHFIGQKKVTVEDNNKASAYVYTIAHHVKIKKDGTKVLMIMYIRYNDTLVKQGDKWFFQERVLHIDFTENRNI